MSRARSLLALPLAAAAATGCGGASEARALIQNKGSDTLVNVAQAWAEAYRKVDPAVAVAVSGGGSGIGITALINGTVDIANCSRQMKESEITEATKRGRSPVEFVVGYDALAVFVHADNPVESLSIEQLARIFGDNGDVTRWSQLGIKMPANADEIVRVGRQNSSGTYAYFKETVLGQGHDYKLGSLDMHGSKEVVELVEKTAGAIGSTRRR